MRVKVKICGLKDEAAVTAAIEGGAAYIGFNFVERSPRYVDPARARDLAAMVPPGMCKVGLSVDAGDTELDRLVSLVPLDMLQLHGSESPERVVELRHRYGLPVMKAIGIATGPDLADIDRFAAVADQLLIDAKAAGKDALPGGNGLNFDWRLLQGRRWPLPWMLAGGLNAGNVAEAVRLTGTREVDLSSGVETAPGVKSPERIRAFLDLVNGLAAE